MTYEAQYRLLIVLEEIKEALHEIAQELKTQKSAGYRGDEGRNNWPSSGPDYKGTTARGPHNPD